MAYAWSILVVGVGGKLLGIDVETGAVRWEDNLKGGGYGEVAIAATPDRVFVSADDGKLFCFAYPTGAPLWSSATSSRGRASIVVEEGRVFVAKSGEIDCFTIDGKRLWTQPLSGRGVCPIALGFPGNIAQADDTGSK